MFERWLSGPRVSTRRSSLHFLVFLIFVVSVTIFLLDKINEAVAEIENLDEIYYAKR